MSPEGDVLTPDQSQFLKEMMKKIEGEKLEQMIALSTGLQLNNEKDDDATHTFHEMMYCITSILKEIKQGYDTRGGANQFSRIYVAEKCDMLKRWASMYYTEIGSSIDE